ncbi:MAG TPA: hypothetical protein VK169_02750 [Saprospiraceae bacterium]|nr:hypothetical protein [Saprospiraceae bacterium]
MRNVSYQTSIFKNLGRLTAFIILFVIFQIHGNAQINVSGTAVTSPALAASYTSLDGPTGAIAALNAISSYTSPGSIILTIDAGYSETAPIKGFGLGSATLNPLLSATNTITIVKASGTVTINAGVGTANGPAASPDGIFYLNGADHVTIDGLTFTDGNTTNATVAMEFGIAFFKRTAGDGCNNNTIQNCTFNMQRINNSAGSGPMFDGSWSIEVLNSTATAATTALTPTNGGTLATNGTNSGNKFYANVCNSGNGGIGLNGFAASAGVGPTPNALTFLGDLGNDVGGTVSGTGNAITNFGGGAATSPSAGIRVNNQWSINIQHNTIDNNNGAGVNHATTLRGIFAQAGTSGAATISNNTITVRSGATTSGLTAIENGVGSTAASNTININSNTIRFSYTTATSGVFSAIINSASAASVNINTNNIQQLAATNYPSTGTIPIIVGGSPSGTLNVTNNTISNFVMTGASGTLRAITASTPTGLYTVTGNTIENLSYSNATSTGSITGVYNLASATLQNVNNNIIRNFSTPTTGTLNGIQNNTVGGTFQCKNNQIYNFSTSAGGAGGFSANGITWSNATVDLSNNIIYSINSTGTTGGTGGTINGITHSGAATVNGNAIYDLSSNSTNVVINGINVGASGTNIISNNLIGDLRAPFSTGNVTINGIQVSSGTTNNIFHNTVNIASSTTSATTVGTSAIYFSSSTPTNNLRNNIFVNTSAPGPTGGFTAAIRYTTVPTATNFPAANNNNFYYAGVPAVNKVIYCEGSSATPTNGQQTIANYKTYINTTLPVSGRESSSVSEIPNFTSTTGSNPITNFLKYDTGIATQIEQGGGVGTGITTDFSGTTVRCPGGGCPGSGSTPDIGAWEQNGVPLDLNGPIITYINLSNVVAGPTFRNTTSFATITDASGVNVTSGTAPRIYYKKTSDPNVFNDNTSSTAGWKYSESPTGSSPFDFTIDYTLLNSGPVVVTDVIQYFVVAQDNAAPTVGINSGTFASIPTSVALTGAAFPIGGSINSYSITPSIGGTILVPGTFPSLTLAGGAFEAINNATVTGNINIEITGDLTSETGLHPLNAFSSPYTVRIYPTGSARIVSGALASNGLIRLNGADRVTLDGSIGGSGSDRSLTITNTSTTSPTAVSLVSLGAGLGAVSNTIKNCNINTGVSASTGYGISVGASTPGTSGADNDNTTIQNNNITVATVSIYAIGNASVSAGGNDNLIISENTINTNTTLQTQGIQVGNGLNGSITSNIVSVQTSGAFQPVGISIETGFVSSSVAKNQITNVLATNTGGYGGRGITVGTGSASSNLTIANNVIYGVNGSNWNAFSNSSSMGIAIGMIGGSTTISTTAGGISLYFNSVNMFGSIGSGSTTAITAALYIGSGASALNIRNNILVNTQTGTSTTQKNYAIYSAAANTAFTSINYNDYFVSNSFNAASAIPGFLSSDRVDLAAVQAGFGSNANSTTGNPLFNNNTNLTIGLGSPVIAAGENPNTTGITTDFLMVLRNTPPTIGAYENAIDAGAPLIIYTALGGTCDNGNRILTATISDPTGVHTSGILQPRIYYRKNAGAWFSSQGMLTSGNGLSGTWDFTIIATDMGGVVNPDVISYFVIAQDLAGTPNVGSNPSAGLVATDVNNVGTPPTTPNTYVIQNTLIGGTYTVGVAGTYPTLTAAVNAYNTSCLTGPIVFQLDDASYTTPNETFPITINANPFASSTNTLTIKPSATSSIFGSSTNSIIKLNGADFVTFDGSRSATVNTICPLVRSSRDLTIENTNSSTSSSIIWIASTLSDGSISSTVKNCIITGNAPSTTVGGIIVSGSVLGTAAEVSNNNVSIINNAFTKSQNGIFAIGRAATPDQNWIFNLNEMGSTVAGNKLGFRGIAVQNAQNFTVAKNIISGVISTAASTSTMSGILVGAVLNDGSVYQNYISDIKQINPTGWGSNGIYLNASTTISNVNVYNNFISEISADGFNDIGQGDNGYGIMVNSGGGYNIDFNTIVLTANQVKTTGLPAAINIASGVTTPATLKIRNNIFGNTQTIGTERFAIICTAPNTVFHTIDNNDYFTSGPNLGRYTATPILMSNLASIQSNLGGNTNSLNITPNFVSLVSPADLKLNINNNYGLNGMAIPVVGISNDFDCNPTMRDINTPDLGADEFDPPCSTIVINSGDDINVMGTLRNLLNCVIDGGTLTFDPTVPTSFITAPLVINKNVTLQGVADLDFDFLLPGLLAGPYGLRVAASKTVTLDDIDIIDKNNPDMLTPSIYPVIDLLGTLKTVGSTTISKQ